MRLQVFLSHNGVCSRRQALDMIQAGRVTVNGQRVSEPSTPVTGEEHITVDGKTIEPKTFSYILLHKPVGYTTTKEDPHADKIVMDLLPPYLKHVSPVGRLDKDSAGLLLLTNDGDLAFRLTHPSFHEDKTYAVVVRGKLEEVERLRLTQGLVLEGKKTLPCRITDVVYNNGFTAMVMTIQEGRKRQIRLMARAVGHPVISLTRVAIGQLTLADLPVGTYRELRDDEIQQIKKLKP